MFIVYCITLVLLSFSVYANTHFVSYDLSTKNEHSLVFTHYQANGDSRRVLKDIIKLSTSLAGKGINTIIDVQPEDIDSTPCVEIHHKKVCNTRILFDQEKLDKFIHNNRRRLSTSINHVEYNEALQKDHEDHYLFFLSPYRNDLHEQLLNAPTDKPLYFVPYHLKKHKRVLENFLMIHHDSLMYKYNQEHVLIHINANNEIVSHETL